MKILLVSDTHGKDYYLEEALELEKPDFLCHMGDLEGSEDYIRMITKCPLAMVSGNNDFWTDLNPEVSFELHGFRIFMTHGHLYGAKQDLFGLRMQVQSNPADLVLYGHTHRAKLDEMEGCLYLCPGNMGFQNASYAVLTLSQESSKVDIAFKTL